MSTASFSNQRLAMHDDASNGTGSSLSVFGVDCNGGGISLDGILVGQTATSQPRTWTIRCGSGGTYDCYPVIEGYASAIGFSPTSRSDNQLRRSCGTSP